jgi:protocatechuate 3,4-dioxygenase beta subunit
MYLTISRPLLLAFVCAFASLTSSSSAGAGRLPTPQGDATRFTDPPDKENETIRRLIDQAKAALDAGKSTTDLLTDPTFGSAHEWPRFRKLIRDGASASPVTITSPNEPGDPLIVVGRVSDSQGRPVKAAVVYAYQTSNKGWYADRAAHISGNEGDRKHARLFGYLKTDGEGRFEVRTIRPGGYPDSDLPAHIHVEVDRPTGAADNLITEIQFDDDPRLTTVRRQQSKNEGFVIAKVTAGSDKRKRVEVELKMR